MFLKKLDTGMLQSNCYVLGAVDEAVGGSEAGAVVKAVVDGEAVGGSEAVVIDPGVEMDEIARILDSNKMILKYIILTHAHIDHILYVGELKEAYGGKVVIHEKDAPLLLDEVLNGSVMFGSNKVFREADIIVKDGDILEIGSDGASKSGGIRLEFIHTPGHTPGSMCIKATELNCIFTGDTLFRRSVGRTDLGAGDSRHMAKSLRRLMELEDELTVYPGHGPQSGIGYEKKYNRYM